MNIKNGDSLDLLKEINSDTVDSMVTDPPYGISFMNKDWDKGVPDIAIWRECLRVMKPGAFAFVMCSPRSDVQAEMVIKLKEAGFQVNFSPIYWVYASGFPKSMNVSKAVDRKLGYEREIISGSSKDAQYSGEFDQKSSTERIKLGAPISEEAKKLNGSYAGFQPKPAVEVIIVAMKPLSEKTYVDQSLKNGKGVTWLDDGRIPYQSDKDRDSAIFGTQTDIKGNNYNTNRPSEGNIFNRNVLSSEIGRFPANLLIQDNVLDTGIKHSVGHNPNIRTTGYGKFGDGSSERVDYKEDTYINDSGDFSRYFSLDSWYSKNIEKLPDYVQRIYPFLYVPKASPGERNDGLEHLEPMKIDYDSLTRINKETADKFGAERKAMMQNIHPTVKPLELMSYLITIGSRPGDIILDPFMGSGTTGVAAKILNRNFIGFEIERKYFEIAEERIKAQPDQLSIDLFLTGDMEASQ